MKINTEYSAMLERIRRKVIVSSQASKGEPFYPAEKMMAMVESVIKGGAGALRLAGRNHIEAVRPVTDLPIIGITKPDVIPENFRELVYITPAFKDAEIIKNAGCDIIAIDATERERPEESLEELIDKIHDRLNCPVMADISTLDEGIRAEKLNADIISTTLSGYTSYTSSTEGPDFILLEKLVKAVKVPVILEGRIETVEHVRKAFDLGAFAVVIGSVITRPHLITQKFVEVVSDNGQ